MQVDLLESNCVGSLPGSRVGIWKEKTVVQVQAVGEWSLVVCLVSVVFFGGRTEN